MEEKGFGRSVSDITFQVLKLEGWEETIIIKQPGHKLTINHEQARYIIEFLQSRLTQRATDVLITCGNCGEYHSIYLPCKGGKRETARR